MHNVFGQDSQGHTATTAAAMPIGFLNVNITLDTVTQLSDPLPGYC